ncbi:MAG: bifunctional adenosylcobinamide kinase/adenosylcobinamide-phosphate guanylyltransferase [Paenibacillaceae bacterium]
MLILVTGGARSGKSKFAEKYTMHLGRKAVYIATAQIYDEEMKQRMELHQHRRDTSGYDWTTVLEPYELVSILHKLNEQETAPIVLVDCLTLWLTNWLLKWLEEQTIEHELPRLLLHLEDLLEQLKMALADYRGTVIMVTNEVGGGIVPEYPLGRVYRDWAGMMNQQLASLCDQVFLVTTGIPIELKRNAFHF